MTRLLKITALVMGLVLLMFTITEWGLRRQAMTERVPLMSRHVPLPDHYELFQIWPGLARPLFLTPHSTLGFTFWGVDPAGETAYYESWPNNDFLRINLYRVGLDHPQPERLVENGARNVVRLSPDYTWLMTGEQRPDGQWDYAAEQLTTQQRWPISALIAPQVVVFDGGHTFSADGQWLYLTVKSPDQPGYDLVALRLADGAVVPVTAGQTGEAAIDLQAQLDDWLLFGVGGTLYRIRRDGTEFGLLITDPDAVRDPADFIFATYPEYGLALVAQDVLVRAVKVKTGELVWQFPVMALGYYPIDATGWAGVTLNYKNMRLHLPTGETQQLPDVLTADGVYGLGSAPDYTWSMFAQPAVSNDMEWWVYDWVGGRARRLRGGMDGFIPLGVSPIGRWMLALHNVVPYGVYRIRVTDGQMEPLLIDDQDYASPLFGPNYSLLGWMRPLERSWQPRPLVLIGLSLLIIGLFPRHLFKLRHR